MSQQLDYIEFRIAFLPNEKVGIKEQEDIPTMVPDVNVVEKLLQVINDNPELTNEQKELITSLPITTLLGLCLDVTDILHNISTAEKEQLDAASAGPQESYKNSLKAGLVTTGTASCPICGNTIIPRDGIVRCKNCDTDFGDIDAIVN